MSDAAFIRDYPDWAKRCSDIVNLHAMTGNWGKWAAVRLSDGGSDGVVYDSRSDAIRHQFHESLCAYILVPPTGMSPRDAYCFLTFNRQAHDAGFRMTDPELIQPLTNEEFGAKLRALRGN